MHLLIDGDVLVYRYGFAAEHMWYDLWWNHDVELVTDEETGEETTAVKASAKSPFKSFENAKDCKAWLDAEKKAGRPTDELVRIPRLNVEPLDHSLFLVKQFYQRLRETLPDSTARTFFSCPTPDNWRIEWYPEYKGHRSGRKPMWYDDIRTYMLRNHSVEIRENDEADDAIAEWAGIYHRDNEPFIIVTNDKDMRQIPGLHLDPFKEDWEVVEVDEYEADYNVALQCIMGDASDNIKGIPKMGEVAANKALHGIEDYWEEVERLYAIHYADDWRYHFALTRLLVTLPTTTEERDALKEAVKDAWTED